MTDFVHQRSIVRRIWGNPDLILLIFAGTAAEFALNRAVDWLFFTGRLPQDPIGRLFSTARFAQQIVFVDEKAAKRTLDNISAIHGAVEMKRGKRIPDWANRDVLFMLIDYSERAHELLYRPLAIPEKHDLYEVFYRVGAGLQIPGLPTTYEEYRLDRQLHMVRDLAYSRYTENLYDQYRSHLGSWRFQLLRQIQAILVPEHVRQLLKLEKTPLLRELIGLYGILAPLGLSSIIQSRLLPKK
jgi:uncharacterized protein (DUF2236 family)